MNLINWSPFQDTDGFFDRYYSLLNRLPAAENGNELVNWRPSVDISETKDAYLIKAELPEVDKDDLDVSIDNGMLTISGERRVEKEDDDEKRHRVERMYGRFSRSFSLPADADEANISAKSKNGMLKVRIPKTAETSEASRQIKVD
jgi:HSP20 family protein